MTTTTAKAPKAHKKAAKGVKSPKASKAPRVKKAGLRAPQVRVLAYLSKVKSPKTRKEIGEGAKVNMGTLSGAIGAFDEAIRTKDDATQFPSLLTLGLVKTVPGGEDGDRPAHEITNKGRKALEKAKK